MSGPVFSSSPGPIDLGWRIWLSYGALFALAIPWYWQYLPVPEAAMWLGVPLWVLGAVAGSLVISLFTARLLSRPWPQEDEDQEDDEGEQDGDEQRGQPPW